MPQAFVRTNKIGYQGHEVVIEDYPDESDFKKKCMRCLVHYDEKDNFGQYLCRYHPGKTVMSRGECIWSCCRAKFVYGKNNGCKRCDHTTYAFVPNRIYRIVPQGVIDTHKCRFPLDDAFHDGGFLVKRKSMESSDGQSDAQETTSILAEESEDTGEDGVEFVVIRCFEE